MNLLQRISLCLLKLTLHKKPPPLSDSPESIATPRGYMPGDYRLTITRLVNLDAKLEDGIERAKNRCYVPRGDE